MLYVAMTRAKHELDLVAPLKYYVSHQPGRSDTHVYGARSRFLTPAVLAAFDLRTWPAEAQLAAERPASEALPRIDVAARLRNQWA